MKAVSSAYLSARGSDEYSYIFVKSMEFTTLQSIPKNYIITYYFVNGGKSKEKVLNVKIR